MPSPAVTMNAVCRFFLPILLVWFSAACQSEDLPFLEELLMQEQDRLGSVVRDPDRYELQILYTRIDRDENNVPHFETFDYRVDPSQYFYPASTVKMPVAILAMERINELKNKPGLEPLSIYSEMQTGTDRPPQTASSAEENSEKGFPNIAHYVKQIFLVSDNQAYNRLYEFLGRDYINQALLAKGYSNTRILHRLEAPEFDYEANRYTNPVSFFHNGKVLYEQPGLESKGNFLLSLQEMMKGNGYIDSNGSLVESPFDFSRKNVFSLRDFERMMRAVIFPDSVPLENRFSLSAADYSFLYRYMSMLPRESEFPVYDKNEYFDGYCKYFIFGDSKEEMPGSIRIFNKVGLAYGYLTDCSYIVDFENGVEFILAATIHVNSNGIYNDGKYDYDEIGIPFLAELGRVIYDYELTRPRIRKPDLSRLAQVHSGN